MSGAWDVATTMPGITSYDKEIIQLQSNLREMSGRKKQKHIDGDPGNGLLVMSGSLPPGVNCCFFTLFPAARPLRTQGGGRKHQGKEAWCISGA